MKRIFIVLFFIGAVLGVSAQEVSSFDEAKTISLATQKPIMILFQGSDWCAPCIKWERAVWSSAKFEEYAQNHLVLLKADFPRRKSNQLSSEAKIQNAALAEQYNPSGYFPFVVLLSPELKVLKSFSYIEMSPEEMINYLSE